MIFFLNWCKSDLKSYFPHIPHEFTSLIFGVLYGIFNDIFFWIRAFFDHKSSFPHIADEFTSVIFRINKGLSADFPEKFLPNFCIFIHPNSLTPTPNSPSAASRSYPSQWLSERLTARTEHPVHLSKQVSILYLWSVSDRIRSLEAYSSFQSIKSLKNSISVFYIGRFSAFWRSRSVDAASTSHINSSPCQALSPVTVDFWRTE